MRKVVIILIGLALALLAINSNLILHDNVERVEIKAELSKLRPWWVPEGVVGWRAVATMDEELRQAIVLGADVPQAYWAKTRCYYNYFDFNEDGRREVLAVLVGPYTTGSGGSMAVLLTEQEDRWQLQQLMTLIHAPVWVRTSKTNGYYDLVVLRAGGGAEVAPVSLTYGKDGRYTSVSTAKAMEVPKQGEGTLLLANDLGKDMLEGGWLTLEKKELIWRIIVVILFIYVVGAGSS